MNAKKPGARERAPGIEEMKSDQREAGQGGVT
jgi:hypothetical protein